MRVLVTCKQMIESIPLLPASLTGAFDFLLEDPFPLQQFPSTTMRTLLANVDAAIVGDDEITLDSLEHSTLRALVKWGIGTDNLDISAISALRIPFSNTPGVFNDDVAEEAIALALALLRGIPEIDASVRGGKWPKFRGHRLRDKRALVIGLGNIGACLAEKLTLLGVEVTAYDPYAPQGLVPRAPTAQEGAAGQNLVFVTAPLTSETRGLVDRTVFERLARPSWIINVGRGPIINEPDLEDALQTRRLLGAALDVYEHEPLSTSSALRRLPNVILGSHNASNTLEGALDASRVALERLKELVA